MENNGLTGSIPNLVSIESLLLRHNFLTGTIPGDAKFENLRDISLSLNMMSGSIPELLFSPTLQKIDLWVNHFSSSLSSRIGDLGLINYLDVSFNDLTGTLPSEIGNLNNTLVALYDLAGKFVAVRQPTLRDSAGQFHIFDCFECSTFCQKPHGVFGYVLQQDILIYTGSSRLWWCGASCGMQLLYSLLRLVVQQLHYKRRGCMSSE
jgi:hypothetical protein